MMMYTEEEVEALITTALYNYYQKYVLDLESEHDDLIIELDKVQKEKLYLQRTYTRLKNKEDDIVNSSINANETDYSRLRKTALNLKRKLNQSELLVERLQEEIKKLKYEIDVYKTKKLKGEL